MRNASTTLMSLPRAAPALSSATQEHQNTGEQRPALQTDIQVMASG